MSDFAIGEQSFKEKPDISQVFIRAIDRCNHMSARGGYVSESAVNSILSTLPTLSREWVYQESERYQNEKQTLVYKKYCGVRLGDPIPLRNDESIPFKYIEDDEGKRIDLNDPNIISPSIKTIPNIDLQAFKETVMEAAEFAGLTWQSELMLLDGGDTVEEIERKKSPYRMPDHIREETQYREDEEDES